MPNALLLIVIGLLSLSLLATGIVLALTGKPGRHRAARPSRHAFRSREAVAPRRQRAAVIVNPTKFADLAPVRAELSRVAAELDWDAPLVLETTKEDPGTGQTQAALTEGVDVICSLGGDGTIRTVAAVLASHDTPMGLLPAGTGNLLARNLELVPEDLASAFRVACTGRNRAIDVGWLTLHPTGATSAASQTVDRAGPGPGGAADLPETPATRAGAATEHAFLVMAGVGLDATIMSETTEEAKAKLGWPAYAATGFRRFLGVRLRATVAVDGGAPIPVHARTVLIGNCGRITGGINLMPDARLDDGVLDVIVLAPKGFSGWVDVTAGVLAGRRGDRADRLQRRTGAGVEITTEEVQAVQVDGDVIGETNRVTARVAAKSLLVRVPATPVESAIHTP